MRRSALVLAVFVLSTGLAVTLEAATITVDDSGGADYTTIKEALAAAASGDTVLVADGTYTGANNRTMDFDGKNIVLLSKSGAATTIIDCQNISHAFDISAGVDSSAVIQGFTIANGNGLGSKGGIYVYGSSPKIVECVIRDCGGAWNGGGIELREAPEPVVVSGCTFISNTAEYRGGGLCAIDTPVIIRDCLFYGNSITTMETHISYGGGGIYIDPYPNGDAVVRSCTFAGNTCTAEFGASDIHHQEGPTTVEHCILAFGSGYRPAMGWLTLTHNVVFGNSGSDSLTGSHSDNLFVDPLFCGMASDDYTLCSDSPCLPGSPGNPWGQLVGALESGCGDCGSAVEQATWGRIKALYR